MSSECFIVGGGPSLRNFDFSKLEGKDVIAINEALWSIPNAKYFITMDYTWLCKSTVQEHDGCPGRRYAEFQKHPAEKHFVLAFDPPRLQVIDACTFRDTEYNLTYDLKLFDKVLRVAGYGGFGTSYQDFRCGSDSGYSAVQLAVIKGYSTIYLLGMDFKCYEGQTHCHIRYRNMNARAFQPRLDEYVHPYRQGLLYLQQRGITVYSCSPISKLNDFLLYVDPRCVL